MRLALQAIPSAHKRHIVHNFRDYTHLVLAVTVTPRWTTGHFSDCIGSIALLANNLYLQKG